jgi:hypothetical protein
MGASVRLATPSELVAMSAMDVALPGPDIAVTIRRRRGREAVDALDRVLWRDAELRCIRSWLDIVNVWPAW